MIAGTAIANATAIPAVSRPTKTTVTISAWTSGPNMSAPRQGAETPHMGEERAQDRDAQRRDADRHREPRQAQRSFEISRRALAEAPGRQLEPDEVPQQNAREGQRQQVEDRRRQRAPARAEPRLDQLDLMERVGHLAH